MDRKIASHIALLTMNDSIGLNGLVPSYLLFLCVARIPSIGFKLPDQQSHMDALSHASQKWLHIFLYFVYRNQFHLESQVTQN